MKKRNCLSLRAHRTLQRLKREIEERKLEHEDEDEGENVPSRSRDERVIPSFKELRLLSAETMGLGYEDYNLL